MSEPAAPDASATGLGERVADWYAESARLRGAEVEQLADAAWLVLTPAWPDSFATNCVVLRRDPGAEALLAWAADSRQSHLRHRYVSAYCDLSAQTRSALAAAGFELTGLAEMALPLPPAALPRVAPGVTAEPVDLRDSGRLHSVLWTDEWMPGIDAETVRQLGDRRRDPSAGETLSWVVRDPAADHPVSGDMAACTDLCLRGWTGEIDAVATLSAFRGKGYADALMAAAIEAATAHGCTHVVLSALLDDWPRAWYARLGFVEVGVAWEALRRDDGLAFASSRQHDAASAASSAPHDEADA